MTEHTLSTSSQRTSATHTVAEPSRLCVNPCLLHPARPVLQGDQHGSSTCHRKAAKLQLLTRRRSRAQRASSVPCRQPVMALKRELCSSVIVGHRCRLQQAPRLHAPGVVHQWRHLAQIVADHEHRAALLQRAYTAARLRLRVLGWTGEADMTAPCAVKRVSSSTMS